MTPDQPEEKAKELMANLIVGTLRMPTISNAQAAQCAIVLCDEMIEEFGSKFPPYSEQEFLYEQKLEFWQQVKQSLFNVSIT